MSAKVEHTRAERVFHRGGRHVRLLPRGMEVTGCAGVHVVLSAEWRTMGEREPAASSDARRARPGRCPLGRAGVLTVG